MRCKPKKEPIEERENRGKREGAHKRTKSDSETEQKAHRNRQREKYKYID